MRCSVATPLFSAADRTQTKAARRRPDQRLHPEACLYLQLTRELCGFDRPISPDSPKPPPPNSPKNARSLSFLPTPTGNHITVAKDAIIALMSSEPGLMFNRLIICLISHWWAAQFWCVCLCRVVVLQAGERLGRSTGKAVNVSVTLRKFGSC